MKYLRKEQGEVDDWKTIQDEICFIQKNLDRTLIWEALRQHIASLKSRITNDDLKLLLETLSLRTLCEISDTAFEVWAILKLTNGNIYKWYSRRTHPKDHAEEDVIKQALSAWETKLTIAWATLVSSLEGCFPRATIWRIPCAELVTKYKIERFVMADREDATYVEKCYGMSHMQGHWVDVCYYPIAQWIHSSGKTIKKSSAAA